MISIVTVQYLTLVCYFYLAVIEKVLLKNALGPDVNEVTAVWRKLHNE
jgi:hypothetical protein